MKTGYIDRNLIQNSALACFLLTSFVRSYENQTAGTASPELLKILLILPIVWHRESCSAIKGRNFLTPLQAVLADCPSIKNQFQERVAVFAPISCQGLNLACSSGLLRKYYDEEKPCFSLAFKQWPRGSKPVNLPSDMLRAIDRLAIWFKDTQTPQLYNRFLGI